MPFQDIVDPLYRLRYGTGSEDKYRAGVAIDPTGSPDDIDRSGAAYLGTRKWGTMLPQFLNEVRNNSGLAALSGESADDQDRLRNKAINAASYAVDEQNRKGLATPQTLGDAFGGPEARTFLHEIMGHTDPSAFEFIVNQLQRRK